VITVSDTTAITTLLKVGWVNLLTALFGRVLIPTAVAQELMQHHGATPACCAVRGVEDSERLRRLRMQADAGEAEAICLAVDAGADVLLIDDKKGRRLAEAEGVRCLGLPAIVLAAWRESQIPSVRAFLDLLEERGNYCLSARAKAELLRVAGQP
jgi:uncharacterized protein